jgi:hypothetical protein
MLAVLDVTLYWWRVMKRASHDTWCFHGHSGKKVLMGAIGLAVTALLIWLVEETAKALPQLQAFWHGVALASAVAVALFVLVLIVMLLRTPLALQREAVKALEAPIDAMRREIAEMRARLATMNANTLPDSTKAELNQLIDTGRMIIGLLEGPEDRHPQGRTAFSNFRVNLGPFLQQKIPSAYNRFLDIEQTYDYLGNAMQELPGKLITYLSVWVKNLEHLRDFGRLPDRPLI